MRSIGLSLGLEDGAGAFCCACRALAAAMRHRHGDLRRAFAILAASLRALLATLVAWEQAAWSDQRRAGPAAASDRSRPSEGASFRVLVKSLRLALLVAAHKHAVLGRCAHLSSPNSPVPHANS